MAEDNQELKTKISDLEARLKAMDEKAIAGKMEGFEKKITELTTLVASKDTEITSLKSAVAELEAKSKEATVAKDKEVADANAKLEASEKEKKELNDRVKASEDKLLKIETEARQTRRLNVLVTAGKTEEEAKALLESLDSLDDANFDKVVAAFPYKKDDEKKDKKEKDKESKADTKIDAEPEDDVKLNDAGDADANVKVIADLSAYAQSIFQKKK